MSGKTSKKMVGGAIYLDVKYDTDEIYKLVFQAINTICNTHKIERDEAIKITNVTNSNNLKIEVINKYSLMPNLINLIQSKLEKIDGITFERKSDNRVWNINKQNFINTKGNHIIGKKFRNRILDSKIKTSYN